jgi:CubicO group peptidase (beta-lactamase class C family)
LERRLNQPLGQLVDRWRWGVPMTGPDAARAVPTGHCPRRQRQAHGEVDDLNAWVLGGVAGHAGLFATAAEVGGWALELANSAADRGGPIAGEVVREFWDPLNRAGAESTWVLGWDTPTSPNSTAGTRASSAAVGHLGFTGTSVWIDRAHDLIVVLLTDRVALGPTSKAKMRGFRPRFHDGIRDLLNL